MRVLHRWLSRLRSLTHGDRHDRDFAAELDSHVQLHIDDNLRAGMPLEEARRAALLAFGPFESVREQRRARSGTLLVRSASRVLHDAFRTVTRHWVFTAATAAVLSFGVGTTASVLGLVDALLFRPPAHVRSPERIVTVSGGSADTYVGYELLAGATELDLAAVSGPRLLTLGAADHGSTVTSQCITASYFPLLGVQPTVGRAFTAADEVAGAQRTVVISDGLWRRQFNADRAAVGQEVRLAGVSHVIAGVTPPGFHALEMAEVDAWLPLTQSPELCSPFGANLLQSSSANWLTTVGRLRDGVSLERARAELQALSPVSSLGGPGRSALTLTPIQDSRRNRASRDGRLALWLAAGTSVVLLIACTNIGGLLAVRALARRREMAVRVQLGATRARLFVQLLAENLLLTVVAGVASVFVAAWTKVLLRDFFPSWSAEWLDPRAAMVLVVFALGAGLLSGIVPAAQSARLSTAGVTQTAHSVTHRRSKLWNGLLIGQVALALMLTIGAGLFVRSARAVASNLGYEPDRLVLVTIDLTAAGIRRESEKRAVFETILDRVESSPLVTSASLTTSTPLDREAMVSVVPSRVPGRPGATIISVSPTYFATMGTRILQGRSFTEEDDRGSERVAIIDTTLASELWPGEDILDRCKTIQGQTCVRIVGLSEPRRGQVLARTSRDLFLPLTQALTGHGAPQALLLRPRDSVDEALPEIAALVRGAAAGRGFVSVRPLETLVNVQARSWRLGRLMFGVCGAMAVVLAALGLFVSLQLAVRQRTAEFGVRLTLGASPANIAGMVLRQGLRLVAVGAGLGLGAGLFVGDALKALLYGVAPTDAVTLIAASAIVSVAALLGCLVPALRAARVDPVAALRTE